MSVAEAVMEKLNALPPKKQEQVLHYVESLDQPAKTNSEVSQADPYEWLKFAASMNLDGPPDWSEKFEDYLNGNAGETGR
ncbi:MAG TPA: hypothetical protein DCQ92_02695 [Verrucomicrobia subdivision 3 bacterium]|nr:hypothetical protein [Limisphaerales bacterium]